LLTEEAKFSKPSKALLAKIDEARTEIFRLTNSLENEANWRFRMKHKQCSVFASKSDRRDFKVVTTCPDSDIYNLISLIFETQLYSKWLPDTIQSTRWDHSKFHQNLYLRFKLPFPFKDRDVLLKGYGDVWNGSKMMIYVGSVESKEAERRLDVKPGAVRAQVLFSGMLLRPLGKQGTELSIIARLDLRLPFLPDIIFDYIAASSASISRTANGWRLK